VRRVGALVAAAVVAVVVLASCSLQTTGAIKGNLHLSATFSDVQDLVAGEAVEISDVQIGSVTAIKLAGYQAVVTLAIKSSQRVPRGAVAVLTQTSLLGEQYVDIQLPPHFDPATGPWLASGQAIPTQETQGIESFAGEAATIAGALTSGDISAAVTALSQGLNGKGPALHQTIADLAAVIHTIAAQRTDLAAVLDNAGRLGASLASGSNEIGTLIDNLASTTAVLAQDRQKLIASVDQLSRLAGDLNTEVLQPHLAQLETILAQLNPVVADLVSNKSDLEGLVSGLHRFVDLIPQAVYQGQLLVSVWLAGLVKAGGATSPFTQSQLPSLTSLLTPMGAP
jgi:phospholipid/cholesterol/gamma-HCH transport system substrate-binding protein